MKANLLEILSSSSLKIELWNEREFLNIFIPKVHIQFGDCKIYVTICVKTQVFGPLL